MCSHPNWKSLATVDFEWKNFVRETTTEPSTSKPENVWKIPNVSGHEAKKAYEDVVNDGKINNSVSGKANKQPVAQNKIDLKQGERQTVSFSRFMNYCEQNDVKQVSVLLSEGCDVNQRDAYGWTPLMCACCAGAKDVVFLLLKSGADLSVVSNKGDSALSLAKLKGKTEIITTIHKWCENKVPCENKEVSCEKKDVPGSVLKTNFHCETCKKTFCETTKEQHITSTLHLFNSGPKKISTVYGIPESNKGFQILLKEGWDKDKGLGPEGSGCKFPPKTTLKQDRKGLGIAQPPARVTHFKPFDLSAVQRSSESHSRVERQRTLNRRELEKTRRRARQKERALRNELDFN